MTDCAPEVTMVERVARAMCALDNWRPENWDAYVKHARAAIEAMREPTDRMVQSVQAGAPEPYSESYSEIWPDPETTWHSMIDAALSEGVKGGGA